MALQDILDAITNEADQKIISARSEHQKLLSQMRETAERVQATKRQELAMQKEKKKTQLKMKTEAHASALKRNVILRKKRELLDRLYEKAVDQIISLPDDKIEPVLSSCLKDISVKGTIQPAAKHANLLRKIAPAEQFTIGENTSAKGGFVFISDRQEQDCTIEYLVQEWLRPRTELSVSRKLFTS